MAEFGGTNGKIFHDDPRLKRLHVKSFQIIGVVSLVCLFFGQPAAGQRPGGQQPGGHLRIDEVFVDFDVETCSPRSSCCN